MKNEQRPASPSVQLRTPQFPPVCLKATPAAFYLGISRRHLATLTAQGRLTYIRIGPRCHLFKRSDLDEFLEKHTVRARGAR